MNLWAESLGLVTGGSVDALKRSLSNYYGLDLTKSKSTDSNKRVLSINSAELSRYYTIEEVDESVAEFEGRVEIVIDDKEGDIQHSIVADKIIFNRTNNSVSAIGNVEYLKDEKGKPESVTAESLTFNLDNWKGSLLKCISKQDKTIDDEEMVFYYVTGEIKKSDTDIMGMSDVNIQTVIGSPYFNISAYDLWMLGSSEFVMILPSMKVGNVPVFVAPFYYHSDNNLYFNPVYGYKTREGMISQNTLYLIGQKEINTEESDFSFLSFDTGEAATNYELNALSLVPSDSTETYSDDYLKFMIDYYSNLGLFLGNEGDLSFKNSKNSMDWNLGLGFSRNISSSGEVYFGGESEWNSSEFYTWELPLRYGLDVNLELSFVDINYKNYSDNYFLMDFYDRTEHFKWIDYFTDQLESGVENLSDSGSVDSYSRTSTDDTSQIKSYTWGVDFSDPSFSPKMLSPYVSKISIKAEEIEIKYSSKTDQILIDDDLEDRFESYDPMYYFFYPDTIEFPLTLSITGTVFDSDYKRDEDEVEREEEESYKATDELFELDNPFSTEVKDEVISKEEEESGLFDLERDDLYDEVKISTSEDTLFSTNMTYKIKQPFTLTGIWDDDEWNSSEDIEYELGSKDLLYEFNPSVDLDWEMEFFNSSLTMENNLELDHYKKSYLEIADQSDLLSIYKRNITELESESTVEFDLLGFSTTYSLDTLLYERAFDEDLYEEDGDIEDYFVTDEFNWDEDHIDTHKLEMDYSIEAGVSTTTVSYDKVLPPLDESDKFTLKETVEFSPSDNQTYTSSSEVGFKSSTGDEDTEIINLAQSFDFDIYGITTTISGGVDYSESFRDSENDEWDIEPLETSLQYKFNNFIDMGISSEYNLEDKYWEDISGEFNIGQISLDVKSDYDTTYTWNSDTLRWDSDGDDKVLQLYTVDLSHNYELEDLMLWKNRITLNIDSNLKIQKNFIKVDKSTLLYKLSFDLDIFDFLTFNLSSTSENKALFLYSDADANLLGIESSRKNLFVDLIKSFNFFNDDHRSESNFNLKEIEIGATYKMPDWNLVFSYTGAPELEEEEYIWYEVFSFFIEWKPLSLVRSNITREDDNWSVKTSAE